MMKVFRSGYVSHGFSLFTGIVFLNMSFFLAEISALKLDQNKQMMENIAKLLAGCAAEEEKDIFGGTADEDTTAKEIDLIFHYQTHVLEHNVLVLTRNISVLTQGIPRFGNYEIYSPPPEV